MRFFWVKNQKFSKFGDFRKYDEKRQYFEIETPSCFVIIWNSCLLSVLPHIYIATYFTSTQDVPFFQTSCRPSRLNDFFCHRYANIFFHIFAFRHAQIFSRALVPNSFVICFKNGALWFKWLEIWVLVQVFQCMEIEKGNNGLQGFHNLHHTMFQYMVCLASYKIRVLKNANHTLFHAVSSLWYSCMSLPCMESLWHSCNRTSPHMSYYLFPVFCMEVKPRTFHTTTWNDHVLTHDAWPCFVWCLNRENFIPQHEVIMF